MSNINEKTNKNTYPGSANLSTDGDFRQMAEGWLGDQDYEDFFAKRLYQLRSQKGVSAREMSLAIGQNDSYINRIENKKAFPSMQVFFSICKYLRVTPTGFFDSDDDRPEHTTLIMDNISSLPEEKLRLVEDMLKMLQ